MVSQPLFRQVRKTRFGIFKENEIIGLGEYRVTGLRYQNTYIKQLVIENSQERLVYRFYPSEEDALTAFRLGQVDVLENMSSLDVFSAEEKQQYAVDEGINLRQYVALLSTQLTPIFLKKCVRRITPPTNPALMTPNSGRSVQFRPLSWAYNSTEELDPFSYDLARPGVVPKCQPGSALGITIDASVSLLTKRSRLPKIEGAR